MCGSYGESTMYGNGETNLIIKTGGNKVKTKITSMSDDTWDACADMYPPSSMHGSNMASLGFIVMMKLRGENWHW